MYIHIALVCPITIEPSPRTIMYYEKICGDDFCVEKKATRRKLSAAYYTHHAKLETERVANLQITNYIM